VVSLGRSVPTEPRYHPAMIRSVWTVGAAFAVVSAVVGCEGQPAIPGPDASQRDGGVADRPVYLGHEGHYCSHTADDDPQFQCTSAYDLICISTYEQISPVGRQPIYLCRLACTPGGSRCPAINDVCCRGSVPDAGERYACVPSAMCESRDAGP
jgi:hypothetical protein